MCATVALKYQTVTNVEGPGQQLLDWWFPELLEEPDRKNTESLKNCSESLPQASQAVEASPL